ncbi:hypothetical protein BCR44DRAFT_33874 [Catenaria anguillulae PL171]|uniref:SH3 domain-containing protein n=1 Tax=Catenaria anguillulae PL171 TaxID=765915 RepID=A0A1Y2HSC6_9FUNG|nr:hypothetical protein BCR44DRAFT_33874 [Catenaria anguillulae PL171]
MLRIQALYDFSAVDQDQLSVRAGDILYVIQRKQQWYYASTNPNAPFSSRSADAGLVPANYFEELDDDDDDDYDDDYYDNDRAPRRGQGRNNSISASDSASQVAYDQQRRRLGPNRYSDEGAGAGRPLQQQQRAPPAYDSDITLLGTVLEPIQGGALLLAADADEMVTVVDVLAKRGMVRARLAGSGAEGLIRWNKLRVWEMESGTVITDIYEAAELFAESMGQDDPPPPPRSAAPPARAPSRDGGRSTPRNEYVPPKATDKAAARAARSSPASSEEGGRGGGPMTRSPSPTNRRYLNPPPAPRPDRSERSMSARSYSPGPPSASLGRSRSTPLSANPARSATPLGRSATMGRAGGGGGSTLTPIRTGTPGRSPTLARTLVGGGSMSDGLDSPLASATPEEMVPRHATLTRGVPAAMLDQTESYSNLRKRTAPVDDLAYSAGVKVAGTGNGGGGASAMVSDITLVKGTKLAPAQYSYTLRVATKLGGGQEVTKKDAEFYALVESWSARLPAGTPLPSLPPALTIGAENNYKQCMVLPAVVAQREKEFAAFCKRLVEVQDVMGGAELVAEFCGLMAPSGGRGGGGGATMGRGGGGGGMTMGRRPSQGMNALAGGVMRMNLDDGRVPTARVGMGRR